MSWTKFSWPDDNSYSNRAILCKTGQQIFTIEGMNQPSASFPGRFELRRYIQFWSVDPNSKIDTTHAQDRNNNGEVADELTYLKFLMSVKFFFFLQTIFFSLLCEVGKTHG